MNPSLQVAVWEFRRWFKWRDQLLGLLVFLGLGLGGYGITQLLADDAEPLDVTVIDGLGLGLRSPEGDRLTLHPAPPDAEGVVRQGVADEIHDGLLIIRAEDDYELVTRTAVPWAGQVDLLVREALARRQAADAGSAQAVPDTAALPEATDDGHAHAHGLATTTLHHEQPVSSKGEKIVAGAMIAYMLMGTFSAVGLVFVSITGEKQLRVTEQVVAAVRPQAWIDGKILGVVGLSLAQLVQYSVAGLIMAAVAIARFDVGLPDLTTRPFLLATFLAMSLLGMLWWSTFFGAVAATISDPQTSARGAFFLVPLLPVVVGFFMLADPEAGLYRVLAQVPGLSPVLLPVRMVLVPVAAWEVATSLLLMLAAIAGLRRVAGRIFATAILMYGKEPSWREVGTWLRRSASLLLASLVLSACAGPAPGWPGGPRTLDVPRDGFALAGTLVLPPGPGPHPTLVFVGDRQGGVRQQFAGLAETLARQGVASWLGDARGEGASGGDADAAVLEDLADDVLATLAALAARPEVDAGRLGLVARGEGAWPAVRAAARARDPWGADEAVAPACLILLAGPVTDVREQFAEQMRRLCERFQLGDDSESASARYVELLFADGDDAARFVELRNLFKHARVFGWDIALVSDPGPAGDVPATVEDLPRLWVRRMAYDPAADWRGLRLPVLALFGEDDQRVPPALHATRLLQWQAGAPGLELRVLAGADHELVPPARAAGSRAGRRGGAAPDDPRLTPVAADPVRELLAFLRAQGFARPAGAPADRSP